MGNSFFCKNRLSPKYYFTSKLPFHSNKYLSSYSEYINLLNDTGFSKIQSYFVFPDYILPLKILPSKQARKSSYIPVSNRQIKINLYNKVIRKISTKLDLIIFKKLKFFKFSPSFIFIAKSETRTIN